VRVAFASARSSPGVTTAAVACASVWPVPVLLVEAGEDGGSLAARFGLALEPGLTSLAAASRHNPTAVEVADHVQPLPGTDGRVRVLIGPPATEPAQALMRSAGARLAGLLDGVEPTVLIDAGRLSAAPAAAALLAGVDRLLLVARPRLDELQTLAHRLPMLTTLAPSVELLLVGDKPYPPGEVADTLAVPVAGVLADDAHAADALAGLRTRRGLARSRLLRTATSLVDTLTADLSAKETTDPSTDAPADVPGSSAAAMPPQPAAATPAGVNGHRLRVPTAGGGR
jgi:hypothetical protein